MNPTTHQPDDDTRRRRDEQADEHPSGTKRRDEGSPQRDEHLPAEKGPGSASADTGMTSDGRKSG
jgi:hypothetical protein